MAPADDQLTDEDRPVFLLGTGCQKGGTAWLHDYLGSSAETDLGFMKEYHVWDRLDLAEDLPGLKRVLKRGRTALDTLATGGRSASARCPSTEAALLRRAAARTSASPRCRWRRRQPR